MGTFCPQSGALVSLMSSDLFFLGRGRRLSAPTRKMLSLHRRLAPRAEATRRRTSARAGRAEAHNRGDARSRKRDGAWVHPAPAVVYEILQSESDDSAVVAELLSLLHGRSRAELAMPKAVLFLFKR